MGASRDEGRRSLIRRRWSFVATFVVSAGVSVATLAEYRLGRDEPYDLPAQEQQRSRRSRSCPRVEVLGSDRMRALERAPAVHTASFDGEPLVTLHERETAGAAP